MDRCTCCCGFKVVAKSPERSRKAINGTRKNAITIGGGFKRAGSTGLHSNACRATGGTNGFSGSFQVAAWGIPCIIWTASRQEVHQRRSFRDQKGNPVFQAQGECSHERA
jgi:hypothetical protein